MQLAMLVLTFKVRSGSFGLWYRNVRWYSGVVFERCFIGVSSLPFLWMFLVSIGGGFYWILKLVHVSWMFLVSIGGPDEGHPRPEAWPAPCCRSRGLEVSEDVGVRPYYYLYRFKLLFIILKTYAKIYNNPLDNLLNCLVLNFEKSF